MLDTFLWYDLLILVSDCLLRRLSPISKQISLLLHQPGEKFEEEKKNYKSSIHPSIHPGYAQLRDRDREAHWRISHHYLLASSLISIHLSSSVSSIAPRSICFYTSSHSVMYCNTLYYTTLYYTILFYPPLACHICRNARSSTMLMICKSMDNLFLQ